MGSFSGLSSSHYAISALSLTPAHRPDIGEFGWTIALAIAIAAVTSVLLRGGLVTHSFVSRRKMVVLLPAIGLIIAGLAIAFAQITGKGDSQVLFSGQDQLPGLVSGASTWSAAALAWLLVFKGIAYGLSLGSFRGGPTFPALFLGAAAGILASHLPGFPIQVGVAVGMAAGVVAVLRLPLSAVVIATVLTTKAGANVEPLIIVGVVVSYLVTVLLGRVGKSSEPAGTEASQPVASASRLAAVAGGELAQRLARATDHRRAVGKQQHGRSPGRRAWCTPRAGPRLVTLGLVHQLVGHEPERVAVADDAVGARAARRCSRNMQRGLVRADRVDLVHDGSAGEFVAELERLDRVPARRARRRRCGRSARSSRRPRAAARCAGRGGGWSAATCAGVDRSPQTIRGAWRQQRIDRDPLIGQVVGAHLPVDARMRLRSSARGLRRSPASGAEAMSVRTSPAPRARWVRPFLRPVRLIR